MTDINDRLNDSDMPGATDGMGASDAVTAGVGLSQGGLSGGALDDAGRGYDPVAGDGGLGTSDLGGSYLGAESAAFADRATVTSAGQAARDAGDDETPLVREALLTIQDKAEQISSWAEDRKLELQIWAEDQQERASEAARDRPMTAALGAFAGGLIIGLLLSR